jgi:hypothetical protein
MTKTVVIRGNGKVVRPLIKAKKVEQPRLVRGRTMAQERADRRDAIVGYALLLLMLAIVVFWLL